MKDRTLKAETAIPSVHVAGYISVPNSIQSMITYHKKICTISSCRVFSRQIIDPVQIRAVISKLIIVCSRQKYINYLVTEPTHSEFFRKRINDSSIVSRGPVHKAFKGEMRDREREEEGGGRRTAESCNIFKQAEQALLENVNDRWIFLAYYAYSTTKY